MEKTLGYSLFFLLFLSLTFGFLHSFFLDSPHYLEGEIGYWTNKLLVAQIGVTGVGGLIAFLGLTILIIAYNIDFKFPERIRHEEEEEEIIPETGNAFSDFNAAQERVAPIERPSPVAVKENIERPDQVEFTLNDRLASERKKEQQNITLTPNRFEETEAESEVVVPKPPVLNVMNAPIILSPTVEPIQELIFEEVKVEPQLTIQKSEEEKKSDDLVEQFGNYDPTLDLASYVYPHLELLENYGSNKISVNADELEANKNKIVETLNHYNIEIDKIKATIGPTVTLYEIIPAPGVRISKIKNLEDDIALSLAALGIRIIAPMPGKGTIGIEVPNMHPEMVSMRSILNTEKFQKTDMDLPIALGKTISNEVYIADLAKMPHLLVAGATGQGKSVGINAILFLCFIKNTLTA